MSTFKLEIVTPERIVYEKDAEMIVVKGVEGELGILPRHIPLVTPLKIAPVKIKLNGKEEIVVVGGGFLEVRKDKVVILAETAELPGEIDVNRALAAKERAEQRLKDKKRQDIDYLRAEIALQKAINRIRSGSRNI